MIDLRSDTVTRPTPGMLDAMMQAAVGDDVFGEDPTVNLLEQELASLFGMESALWCASGTMSNQIAIATHTRPGDEVICEQESHVYYYEGGGIAYNAGCQTKTLAGDRGRISAVQVRRSINADDVHKARTSLVCLENTCNRGGGSCYEPEELVKIRAVCDEHQLNLHLDGARLFNALIAKDQQAKSFGAVFHSISVCFNKGLGCPAGSILMGTAAFIRQARRVRKVFGGGLRQAGFLAATARYAMEHHLTRLHTDHEHAKLLGAALETHPQVALVLPVETNLVIFELKAGLAPGEFISRMRRHGILLLSISDTRLRMVTHLDVHPEMIETVIRVLGETVQ